MSITSTRVKSIPFLYGGCGGQGVQPMGSCSFLAIVEETAGPGGAAVLRPFVSLDDGKTWDEEIEHYAQGGLAQSRIRMTGSQIVLGGVTGPQATSEYEMYDSVGVRTFNGGRQWRSIMTPDNFAAIFDPGNDYWEILDFIIAGTKVFAVGDMTSFGVSKSYLTSLDGGITFNNPRSIAGAPFGITAGAYLGNDILIFGGTNNPAQVQRSVDGGDTWAAVTLPGAAGSTAIRGVAQVGPLGSGRVVVVGTRAGAAVAFFSTDFGQTWTQSTLSGGVTAQGAMDVVAASALNVVIGLNVNAAQVAAGKRPLALSTDGGATFADFGAYATPLNPALGYVVQQLAVADDGTIIAMVQTTDFTNVTPNEIWRAVIDGFVGNGPGVALNRRITNQALLVWDETTGQYGPSVQWVGPRHVFSEPWELDDPQPAEAAPATKANEPGDVIALLGVELEWLRRAQRGVVEMQAALVVATDAWMAWNDLLGTGGGADPTEEFVPDFLDADQLRVFAGETLVATSSMTESLAQAQHLTAEAGEAIDEAIALTEGDIVLVAERPTASGPPDFILNVRSLTPDQIRLQQELDDLSGIPLHINSAGNPHINSPVGLRTHEFGTPIDSDIDNPRWTPHVPDQFIPYFELPGFLNKFQFLVPGRWERDNLPDSNRPTGIRGDVPELLDDSIRNVSAATDAVEEFVLRTLDAVSRAAGAAERQATNDASADTFGGCAPS